VFILFVLLFCGGASENFGWARKKKKVNHWHNQAIRKNP